MHFFSRIIRDISWSVLGNFFGDDSRSYFNLFFKLLLLYSNFSSLFHRGFFFKYIFLVVQIWMEIDFTAPMGGSPRLRHTKKISRPEHISPYEYGSGEEISLSRTTKIYIKTEFVIHNQPASSCAPTWSFLSPSTCVVSCYVSSGGLFGAALWVAFFFVNGNVKNTKIMESQSLFFLHSTYV